jgi:hypothetical protein
LPVGQEGRATVYRDQSQQDNWENAIKAPAIVEKRHQAENVICEEFDQLQSISSKLMQL